VSVFISALRQGWVAKLFEMIVFKRDLDAANLRPAHGHGSSKQMPSASISFFPSEFAIRS